MAAIGVWSIGSQGSCHARSETRQVSGCDAKAGYRGRAAGCSCRGATRALAPTRIIELKIPMVPHAAAPSVAHWRSFEASIARVANRGSMAPTVRVDHDLRGATIQIDGWDVATAIRMVRLHATNSPSPQLWESRDYEVSVIHSGELISP